MPRMESPRARRGQDERPGGWSSLIVEHGPLDVNVVSRYLLEAHGLNFAPGRLEEYRRLRLAGLGEWGPALDADGSFTRAGIEDFAQSVKLAKEHALAS